MKGSTGIIRILLMGLMFMPLGKCFAQEIAADIEILGVSPRDVAASDADIFDEASSGLNVVAKGQKMYFEAVPDEDSTAVNFAWAVTQRPSGSVAPLSATTGDIVTFRPDAVGVYMIQMTPMDAAMASGTPRLQKVYAARYAGVGSINTSDGAPRAPECGTGFCHGGSNADPDLNVMPIWIQSNHAQKLQNHLNGNRGAFYSTACLECHTVGGQDPISANNGGFDDVAQSIGFDLNQIPGLVADAVNNNNDNFGLLPVELQNLASVQCESCHGAGSLHPQNLQQPDKGIAGVNLDFEQCARCHDSASGFQQLVYAWNTSAHPLTSSSAEGRVTVIGSCLKCHTGEGFVNERVDGNPPQVVPDANPITCSTCHDPHFSNNAHQLRLVGDFTLDSGDAILEAGLGGLCMRCHNSRVADVGETLNTSFRGAHHGPQADMLAGANGASFFLPFARSSAHVRVVDDMCVACHMAEPPEAATADNLTPPAVGSHSFAMRDDMGTPDPSDDVINAENACAVCHSGLDTYDRPARGDYDGDGTVEGIQTEVRDLLTVLREGILSGFPDVEEEAGFFTKIEIDPAAFETLNTDQRSALYNYNFVLEDGSFGVHNASYAVQLLQRSYFGVFGRPITLDFPNITLRADVQQNSLYSTWAVYE